MEKTSYISTILKSHKQQWKRYQGLKLRSPMNDASYLWESYYYGAGHMSFVVKIMNLLSLKESSFITYLGMLFMVLFWILISKSFGDLDAG